MNKGKETSTGFVLHLFLAKLFKEINNFYQGGPSRIIFAWDGGRSQERIELNRDYKAGRQQASDIFFDLCSELNDMCERMGIINIRFPGIEADDVIFGILESERLKADENVVITTDSDFMQLFELGFHTTMVWNPSKSELMKWDKPYSYILWKSMVGDKSDNIKGIHGCGAKTAHELLESHNLEQYLEIGERKQQFNTAKSQIDLSQNPSRAKINDNLTSINLCRKFDEEKVIEWLNKHSLNFHLKGIERWRQIFVNQII